MPDISANADEYTAVRRVLHRQREHAVAASAPRSAAARRAGWFGIGGTSLSSPLWAAITADRDSFQGRRTGNINPLLYLLLQHRPRRRYFHDITGHGPQQQAATNNGLFPTTPGYDEATGIGTPKFAAIITG